MPPISAAVLPECRFFYPCPHLSGVASLSSSPTVIAKSYPIRTVIQLSRCIEGFPQGAEHEKAIFMRILKNYSQSFLPSHYSIGKFSSENKKLFCFQTPSLVPNWVGRFGRSFLKKIFCSKTQKPPKILINRAFSAVKFFLKFFFFDCKKAENRL